MAPRKQRYRATLFLNFARLSHHERGRIVSPSSAIIVRCPRGRRTKKKDRAIRRPRYVLNIEFECRISRFKVRLITLIKLFSRNRKGSGIPGRGGGRPSFESFRMVGGIFGMYRVDE